MKKITGVDPHTIMKGVRRRVSEDYVFMKKRGRYKQFLRFKSDRIHDQDGFVKRIKYYWAIYGFSSLTLDSITHCKYDKKERRLTCWAYDLKHKLRLMEINVYNRYKKIEKNTLIQCDRRGEPACAHIHVYTYNANGRLTDTTLVSSEYGKASSHYSYDERGRCFHEKVCINNGEIENEYLFKYEGNKEFKYYEGGNFSVTRYDKNVEIYKSFTPEGVLIGKSVRRYNERGHMICQEVTDYWCDCTGVHIIPRSMTQVVYNYYE